MESGARIWKPLNEKQRQIRLFVLDPAEDKNAAIAGELIIRSVDHPLQYDAISHTWGPPSHCEPILINKVEWGVTTNVFQALRHLRDPKDKKCFWMDALCVNQSDRTELGGQVQLMQLIFFRATTVQVWLGQDPATIDTLIDDINNETSLRRLFSKQRSTQEIAQNLARILELARLEYWNRTWIIQEVTLARNLRFRFGAKAFSFAGLSSLCEQMDTVRSKDLETLQVLQKSEIKSLLDPIISASELFQTATIGGHEKKAVELTQVMQRVRLTKCHDPRDRVYGLLGIMTAMFGLDFLEANYEWTPAAVYTRFAGRLMDHTHSLVLLNQAESSYDAMEQLPSWVPNFASPFSHNDAYRRLCDYEKFAAAAQYSTAHPRRISLVHPMSRLICTGHIFSTIDLTSDYCSLSNHAQARFGPQDRRELALLMKGWFKLYTGPEAEFVRTITVDGLKFQPSAEECFVAVQTPRGGRTSKQVLIKEQVLQATCSRRFFVTETGMPALGPRDMQKGDAVAILAGGRVPYVLRKKSGTTPDGLDIFSFVGECYVQGVMHGELLKGPDVPELTPLCLE